MLYKKIISRVVALAFFGMIATTSVAHAQAYVEGKVVAVHGDQDGYYIEINKVGSCGSKLYYVNRSWAHYKEFVATALASYLSGRTMRLHPNGNCRDTINVLGTWFGAWN